MQAVDEIYDRMGRYLPPDIKTNPIPMRSQKSNPLVPRPGRCARTGIEGDVVGWIISDTGGIRCPTNPKLIWMLGYQNYIREGKVKDFRILGNVAILPDRILSSFHFAAKIPGLSYIQSSGDLLRQVVNGDQPYLLLSFGKNIDDIFGNGLRYSSDGILEVNGELKIQGMTIENRRVDFRMARRLVGLGLDWDDLSHYCYLRNRTAHSDHERNSILAEIASLRAKFGDAGRNLVALSRQVTREDLLLGRWLQK